MNLTEMLQKAAKAIHSEEKFAVQLLALKAERAATENPYDAPVITASHIFKKMASDNKTFISRAELNKLYDHLYTSGTKLTTVFAEELAREPLKTATIMQRSEFENMSLTDDYKRAADPVLANALEAAFSGKEAKLYSSETGKKAEISTFFGLKSAGLEPKKVDVFAGQGDIIICQAEYETPKGPSYALVPVEIKDGTALVPDMFFSQAGFVDLTEDNLEKHIKSTAGKSFRVDGQKLLDVLSTVKNGAREDVSDVDLAIIKLRAEVQGADNNSINGILYQQVDTVNELKTPELEQPAEYAGIGARLSSAKGMANHVFGERAVKAGLDIISRKMNEFGYKQAQVSVASVETDSVVYAVSVDRSAGFTVPVKIQDGMAMIPNMVFASGNMADFSQQGIAELSRGVLDKKALVQASPAYGLKPSELMDQVRSGIVEQNFAKVEDAIDVLGQSNPQLQKEAIALMVESFSVDTLKKVASETKGCCMITKTSASQHPLCGHLNLPLHKVYQDERGDCQPLYRKAMSDNYEGASFMVHKIFENA